MIPFERRTRPSALVAIGLMLAFVVVAAGWWSSLAAGAASFPKPQGYVNDFAGLMGANAKASLEAELTAFAARTGAEIAVATVPSASPYDSKTYAVKLFQAWGLGKKGRDNGVLLLLAAAERRVEIEVGYGVEERLTDGKTGEILDTEVLPYLKAGDYDAGLTNGARAVMKVLEGPGGSGAGGGAQAPAAERARGGRGWGFLEWAAFIFVLAVLAMIVAGERGGRGPGGRSGGGGGGSRSDFESLPGSRRRTGGGWFGFPGPGPGSGRGGGGGFGGFGGGRSGGGGAGRGF